MTNISSYDLPQMTDLVKRSFTKTQEMLPQVMRTSWIVIADTLPMHTGDSKRYAERIHRSQYAAIRAEWDSATGGKVQYGYEKDMQVYTVAMEIGITKRMRTAGKNQDILDDVTRLSEVCPNTMDLDLTHRLTFAWSTSYSRTAGGGTANTIDLTVGDGLALISASHTLTGSATTYSNQITSNPAFSKSALETGERSFAENSFDNFGVKVSIKPDTIFSADDPETVNDIRELLKSTATLDSNINAGVVNVYQQKYKHVVLPRLATDANGGVDSNKRKYWFLADTRTSDFYLSILEEPYLKTPMDGNNGEDFSSENWNYLAAGTYGMAIVTGRWIRGSKGDAS